MQNAKKLCNFVKTRVSNISNWKTARIIGTQLEASIKFAINKKKNN